MGKIQLVRGDITKIEADAIVNAANNSLLGGGGVDGEIHEAAGPELLNECEKLNGCETGNAKITKAYNLPSRYVIHAVGPVYKDGTRSEDKLLASAYKRSLELAAEYKLKTVAFPNISTGAYRFPKFAAASIAIKTARDFLDKNEFPQTVIFVAYDYDNYAIYREKLGISE
jgi:O-acetyl-ADP-ribose deacetylase (regulator of RNase III)